LVEKLAMLSHEETFVSSGHLAPWDMETLQKDLDDWLNYYNNKRTHQGKICNGRTPLETLLSGKLIWDGKNLNQI